MLEACTLWGSATLLMSLRLHLAWIELCLSIQPPFTSQGQWDIPMSAPFFPTPQRGDGCTVIGIRR
jgi:hypothetical protein